VQLADSDPDSLMRVWAGQDRPEYLLLRGHRSEQAGQGQTARTDWLNFLDRYPFHPYTDYIHYRLGRSYAGEDSWRAALDHLLPLHRAESHTGELEHRIATTLVDLYQQLNPADGEEMLARLNRPLARRCLAAVAAARGKLAVLPLSGSDSEWGRDLARSLRIGRELFAPSGPELPLLDDRSDPLYHAQLLAALTDDRDWLLLQSARAEFLAPVQLLPRLHVVCPDRTFPATEALPTLSLHLDPLLQARLLADWALDTLGLRRFAVLAPADTIGRQMAREFSLAVEQRCDSVLFTSYFFPGSDDIGKQLGELREFGLELDFRDSLRWSLADTLPLTAEQALTYDWSRADTIWLPAIEPEPSAGWYHSGEVLAPPDTSGFQASRRLFCRHDSLFQVVPPDSLPLPPEILPDLFEIYQRDHPSKSCPVRSIEAIFFPLYSEDVNHMATQLAFYHFEAQLLGSEFWIDWAVRGEAGTLLRGMIAPLPFAPSPAVERFISEFYNVTYRYPDLEQLLTAATPALMESLPDRAALRAACDSTGFRLDSTFVWQPGLRLVNGFNHSPQLGYFDGDRWLPLRPAPGKAAP